MEVVSLSIQVHPTFARSPRRMNQSTQCCLWPDPCNPPPPPPNLARPLPPQEAKANPSPCPCSPRCILLVSCCSGTRFQLAGQAPLAPRAHQPPCTSGAGTLLPPGSPSSPPHPGDWGNLTVSRRPTAGGLGSHSHTQQEKVQWGKVGESRPPKSKVMLLLPPLVAQHT